jgi:hypothetical protein
MLQKLYHIRWGYPCLAHVRLFLSFFCCGFFLQTKTFIDMDIKNQCCDNPLQNGPASQKIETNFPFNKKWLILACYKVVHVIKLTLKYFSYSIEFSLLQEILLFLEQRAAGKKFLLDN